MSEQETHRYVNEGIQGNVRAEVVAVGRKARATKTVGPAQAEEAQQALSELRAAIGALGLRPEAHRLLEKEVSSLAQEIEGEKPDLGKAESYLKNIAEKLKMVGIVLGDALALAEPAKKIAGLIGLPLSFLST